LAKNTATLSDRERLERDVKRFNSDPGTITDSTGYDCPICLNKTLIGFINNERLEFKACRCLATRSTIRKLKASGLGNLFTNCTFDNYNVSEPWARDIKAEAQRFLNTEPQTSWLYVGGQVGSGKTHLCTAIMGEYLKRGKSIRYMLWVDDSARLKAIVNDGEAYSREIEPLKKCDVLYVDDLFKTQRANDNTPAKPTPADIRLAFEILNYRYVEGLLTVISSEYYVNELLNLDEGLGSRIFQQSKGYHVNIGRDPSRNHRVPIQERII